MPNNWEEELAAILKEIENDHVSRTSIYGGTVCEGCSTDDGKFEMMWPCAAVRLSMAVRRAEESRLRIGADPV